MPTAPGGRGRLAGGASDATLLVAAGVFAGVAGGDRALLLAGTLVAVGLGVVLRRFAGAGARPFAPVPILAGLGLAAVVSPLGLVPALAAGAAGLVFLLWLADDPHRPAGGVRRAGAGLLLPALAVAMSWVSALLLPPGSATVGVAAGLLVLAIGAVAFLLARPRGFDREEALTS